MLRSAVSDFFSDLGNIMSPAPILTNVDDEALKEECIKLSNISNPNDWMLFDVNIGFYYKKSNERVKDSLRKHVKYISTIANNKMEISPCAGVDFSALMNMMSSSSGAGGAGSPFGNTPINPMKLMQLFTPERVSEFMNLIPMESNDVDSIIDGCFASEELKALIKKMVKDIM
jgi:hypothetical protein